MKLLLILLVGLFPLPAFAAVLISSPDTNWTSQLTITEDLSFLITADQTPAVTNMILSDWVTNDGSMTFNLIGTKILYSINHGPTQLFGGAYLYDNADATFGAIGPNDGIISFLHEQGSGAVTGDILTIKAATYTFSPHTGFNPEAYQAFSGILRLTDKSGNIVGIAIPEISSSLLLCGSLLLTASRRKR